MVMCLLEDLMRCQCIKLRYIMTWPCSRLKASEIKHISPWMTVRCVVTAHGSPCTHSESEREMPVVIPDGFDSIVNKVNSCCPLFPCHSVILSAKEIWFCWPQVPVLQCCCEPWWEKQVDRVLSWQWYKFDRSWAADKILSCLLLY